MLYLYFCPICSRIHILSGRKMHCPACDTSLTSLSVTFSQYAEYSKTERTHLLNDCILSAIQHNKPY